MNSFKLIFLFLILGLSIVAIAAGCGDDDDDDDDDDDNNDSDDDDGGELWQPEPGTSWQWQLSGTIDTSFDVEMYDVDLMDTPESTISALQNAGRIVICYFSAGSYENWRDDAGDFPEEALGNNLEGWEGERWLDVTNDTIRDIMEARMDMAAEKGCDGVEPDNMDGYANANGMDLSADDQLNYNRFIADSAHDRGLSVGLKNDMDQLSDLVEWFDWALNEECHGYDECDLYEVFTDAGKAVFNAEYVDDWADSEDLAEDICGQYPDLDTIIKEWDLTANRLSCDEY